MKFARILKASLAAFLAILGIAVLNVQSANASPLNPWRFHYSSVCVNNYLPGSNWPVNYSRDRWNQAADLNVYYGWMITTYPYFQGCAETYAESQRIDVRYYNDASNTCVSVDVIRDPTYGFVQDANIWLNTATNCSYYAEHRAHYISQAIGYALGLDTHENGARSVMSTTAWSIANVWYPEPYDFDGIEQRYPW